MSCSRDTDGDGNCGQRYCPGCGIGREIRLMPKGRTRGQIFQNMPNPTDEDLKSPEFEAVWNTIKRWDVSVPEFYDGYCGATGSHVKLILNALEEVNAER